MNDQMKSIKGFLFRIETILICFLIVKSYQFANVVMNDTETDKKIAGQFILFLVYVTLTYFAYKRNRIATWLFCINMIFGGVVAIIQGAAYLPADQYGMRAAFVIVGVYFVAGGTALLRDLTGK